MIRIVLLFHFLSTAVALTCPSDWIGFQEKCYGFGEDTVPWGDADDICRMFGGRLAEVETEEENNFLKNECSTKQGYIYWLGGTDIFHEGIWRWVSSGDLINSFKDWAPGRPNDNGGQDCLVMQRDMGTGYQWNDGECSDPFLFICEAKPLDAPVEG